MLLAFMLCIVSLFPSYLPCYMEEKDNCPAFADFGRGKYMGKQAWDPPAWGLIYELDNLLIVWLPLLHTLKFQSLK